MATANALLGGVPRIRFTKERRRRFEATSDDLVERALRVYQEFHQSRPRGAPTSANERTSHWKLVKRKKALSLYRQRAMGFPAKYDDRTFLCSGVMPGTVDDMVSGAYADETENLRTRVQEGASISQPLIDSEVFPPMVSQMVKIGEETGELEKMLSKVADFYEDEVDASIQALTSIVEPLMMVGVGVMVGIIIISMYLPMFKMLSLVK